MIELDPVYVQHRNVERMNSLWPASRLRALLLTAVPDASDEALARMIAYIQTWEHPDAEVMARRAIAHENQNL